ncbi:flavin-containing monooxygenase 5-like [Physella acuta]|uniref:flavin-containing monooxygenase 5-like n=1 Tax=Physella acuta TaxID=109671 RepID=UPI0027DDDAC5|nr:flavin-containing monooxygenase 5-like [Physella acuta]
MAGRVGIIGGGSSGITAVKNLLDAGFSDVVCYERRDVIGGLWYFKEDTSTWKDESCVNRSTVINTSKEFMAFSDYPMPDYYPNFCHNEDVEAYFLDYSQHFGVDKYIQRNTEVMYLKKHSSYNSTGRWEMRLKNHKTGQETTEVFDFIIVANGHHGAPNLPSIPGLDKFTGKTMHSKDFKDVRSVTGKKAVVLGIGNSGGDVSVELSKYMKVFLCTRRGAWILNRLVDNGLPWDYFVHVRLASYMLSWLPRSYRNKLLKDKLNQKFCHDLYHLTPVHEPDATHPTVNDELPNRIAAGMVKVKPNIRSFTEKGVTFEDGTHEEEIDLVVFATGYKVEYPFIEKSVLEVRHNKVELYKYMWLPVLPKQTIAFLAVCQPLGAMFPIAELQSRLAARVFKGEVTLPSPANMKKDIAAKERALQARYVHTDRHTIQVDWLPYMDELAELTGCKPNLVKLLFTDPPLFWQVIAGPCVPYQYRLHGPNSWPGARQAIFTVLDRIKKPFETRPLPKREGRKPSLFKRLFVTSALIGAVFAVAAYKKENILDYIPRLRTI